MANADLRPMTLGEVLDRTFSLYKSHFWLFVGLMSGPFLILLLTNVVTGALGLGRAAALGAAGPGHAASISGTFIGGVIGGGLIVAVIYLALVGAAQAATVFAVSDLYLGGPATIASSFKQVRGNVGKILGVMFLTGLVVGVGFILLIVPGVILLCRTGIAIPAAMIEGQGPRDALSRSWELTKGFAMQIFLIFLLVWIIGIISIAIFQVPITLLAGSSRPQALSFGVLVLQNLSSFISQVLVGPVGTIAYCLMYYNLRVRKEAFDLQHLMSSMGTGSTPEASTPGTVSPA